MSYSLHFNCRKCSLIAGFLLLFQFCSAQSQYSGLDNWLQDNIKDLGGRAVLLIYKDGQPVYNHAENNMSKQQQFVGKIVAHKKGISKEEALEDFNSQTRLNIASCSKWLSAALVMTFVDEGKLNINDSIGKYLPMASKFGKGNILIWQCLSHLTGIKALSLKSDIEMINQSGSMDAAIEQIVQLPMEGTPGKTFHYSGIGLQLAAAVIEKISGKSFETLFNERMAIPCEMTHTDFGHKAVPLAAGGAISTADDYIHFLTMILNNGIYNGKKILTEHSILEMETNRISPETTIAYSPAQAGNWGYGFGEWVMDNTPFQEASNLISSPGLFGSFPWINKRQHYCGFLMTFNLHHKGRNERYMTLKEIVEKAIKE